MFKKDEIHIEGVPSGIVRGKVKPRILGRDEYRWSRFITAATSSLWEHRTVQSIVGKELVRLLV